jgi:transposase-like protein
MSFVAIFMTSDVMFYTENLRSYHKHHFTRHIFTRHLSSYRKNLRHRFALFCDKSASEFARLNARLSPPLPRIKRVVNIAVCL